MSSRHEIGFGLTAALLALMFLIALFGTSSAKSGLDPMFGCNVPSFWGAISSAEAANKIVTTRQLAEKNNPVYFDAVKKRLADLASAAANQGNTNASAHNLEELAFITCVQAGVAAGVKEHDAPAAAQIKAATAAGAQAALTAPSQSTAGVPATGGSSPGTGAGSTPAPPLQAQVTAGGTAKSMPINPETGRPCVESTKTWREKRLSKTFVFWEFRNSCNRIFSARIKTSTATRSVGLAPGQTGQIVCEIGTDTCEATHFWLSGY